MESLAVLPKAHQIDRYRHRGHRGRDRCLRDRQREFQQRRVGHRERGAVRAIGPEPASRRSNPAGLAFRVGNDHHRSGGEQGQGGRARCVPGRHRQPRAEAERRLVRSPHDQDQLAAPRLPQHELRGHRRDRLGAPVLVAGRGHRPPPGPKVPRKRVSAVGAVPARLVPQVFPTDAARSPRGQAAQVAAT